VEQPIEFEAATCGSLDAALELEWLETNGGGGFASSTVAGAHTRRYHGLLVAALRPPVRRYVLLSKLEDCLTVGDQRFDLSANVYPGVVHPAGYRYLRRFRLDPFPVFTYEAGGVAIEKSVFMPQGENTTVVEYRARSLTGDFPAACRLEVRALIAFRDYHATTHANTAIDGAIETADGLVSLRPYPGLPTLYLAHDAAAIAPDGAWYYRFQYPKETERGLDDSEDLFCPLVATFDLSARPSAVVVASTGKRAAADAPGLRAAEIERRESVRKGSAKTGEFALRLAAAAGQFMVRGTDRRTVIAGYHWFTDWGRDAMIALPGLTLATGRSDAMREILHSYAAHADRGMLPNRFADDSGEPQYNTIDATLWFFDAVLAYVEATGDEAFVRARLYPVLKDIVEWHVRGTRHDIHVDDDGLLMGGGPDTQLTWMDARVGGRAVTPRAGKPVEIQGLWYNALCVLADLAEHAGEDDQAARARSMAARARASFEPLFWNEPAGCLYDAVDGASKDASIRPNQAIALSLPHTMLSRDKARRALAVVERDLLTPYGLRTLAPSDPRYRGRYEGPPESRDAVYHQGTVWPWLLGRFITAYRAAYAGDAAAMERVTGWTQPFEDHLRKAGLGQISEIFDGDPPHTPRGCIAQAWSVGELLRVL
jgi:predicted glycogen debranching enzyme